MPDFQPDFAFMRLFLILLSLSFVFVGFGHAYADMISSDKIVTISSPILNPNGLNQLDLILMSGNSSGASNSSGAFNGFDANTQTAGGSTTSFAESYATTAGKLQDFYRFVFPNGFGGSTVDSIVLFLNLNESGSDNIVSLDRLDIWLNPASVSSPNLLPLGADLTSAQQNGINQVFTGGTKIAFLDSTKSLTTITPGHGAGDYAVLTGIKIFDLNPTDELLFNISMSSLTAGADSWRLSGMYSINPVPEPGAIVFLLTAFAGTTLRRSRLR